MPSKRTFTDEEIKQIIKLYSEEGFTISYIAKTLLKCRESTISNILKQANITIRDNKAGRKLNINEEAEIINLYTNCHYSQKQIAEKYNCCTETIHKILIRNNIPIVVQARKNREQNNNYFDAIDSEHKAYWLGFIFADGCIDKNQLSIEINEKDIELLKQFKQDLNLNSTISMRKRKTGNMCCIRMSSPHLCESLAKYGIVANKTKETKHLPYIDKEFLPHFLRGLIDGDGWINLAEGRYYRIGLVSYYQSICEDVKKYCNLILHAENVGTIIKDKNCYRYVIQCQKFAKQLANALYKDNTICLSRKYRYVEPLLDFKNDEDIV